MLQVSSYYQRLPISPGAVAEVTAQRESCRMTQHTARQSAWLTREKLGSVMEERGVQREAKLNDSEMLAVLGRLNGHL
ncbi:hypothetical protein NQZ68_001985 [Dissostichus eleginoides]|nr:hypothetical protein NQZ68_001985 [Dissostichus eleginoides]